MGMVMGMVARLSVTAAVMGMGMVRVPTTVTVMVMLLMVMGMLPVVTVAGVKGMVAGVTILLTLTGMVRLPVTVMVMGTDWVTGTENHSSSCK